MTFDDGIGRASLNSAEIAEITRALRSHLRKKGVDAHTSEDVVQEAWLHLLRDCPLEADHRRGWLFVATQRIALAMKRSTRNRRQREIDAGARADEAAAAASFEATTVGRWIDGLPEPYARVVRLRFVEEHEIAEIARMVGRPEVTVRSQIKRGLDRLRARAQGSDIRPRAGRRSALGALFGRWRELFGPRRRGWRALHGAAWVLIGLALVSIWWRSASAHAAAGAVHPAPDVELVSRPSDDRDPQLLERAVAAPSGLERELAADVTAVPLRVTGFVRAPDGSAVAGAAVSLGRADGSHARAAALTDERGRYEVASADPDAFLWASADNWFASRRRYLRTERDPLQCDLMLAGTGETLHVVVESNSGARLAGSRVIVQPAYGKPRAMYMSPSGALELTVLQLALTADEHGAVDVALPAETFRLRVDADGQPSWTGSLPPQALASRSFTVHMPPPIAVRGIVVDAAGRPASDVRIELVQLDGEARAQARSDERGRFAFEHAAPGEFVLTGAASGGTQPDSCRREGRLDGPAEFDLRLAPDHTLRGRVLDPGAGARVQLVVLGRPQRAWEKRSVAVARDGSFAFTGCDVDRRHRVELLRADGDEPLRAVTNCASGIEEVVVPAPTNGERADVVIEFECDAGAELPTLAELRAGEPPVSLVAPVDPHTRRATFRDVLRSWRQLRAWLPGAGTWRGGPVHADVTFHRARVPRPSVVEFDIALPDGVSGRDVRGTLLIPGFNTNGFEGAAVARVTRELVVDERGRVEILAPSGEYEYAFHIPGRADLVGSIHVDEESPSVTQLVARDGYDVELELRMPRALRDNELQVLEARTPRGWTTLRGRDVKWLGETSRARTSVPLDALELRVSTNFGLRGAIAIPPRDAAEGAEPRHVAIEVAQER